MEKEIEDLQKENSALKAQCEAITMKAAEPIAEQNGITGDASLLETMETRLEAKIEASHAQQESRFHAMVQMFEKKNNG
jgi:hypothetical protein